MAQGFVQESEESDQTEEDVKPKPKKRKAKVKKSDDNPPGGGGSAGSGGGDDGDKPGAIVKYEGIKDEDLVDEEIDEKILKLLGIENVFEFDYGDYKTLLKEKLVELDIKSSQVSPGGGDKSIQDSQILLIDELKRVKRKTGKFKVKPKKITAENFIPKPAAIFTEPKERYLLVNKISSIDPKKIADTKEDSDKDSLLSHLIEIKESVSNILSVLSNQTDLQKNQLEIQRLDKQRKSRRKKEDNLEQIRTAGKNAIKSVIAPVQNILDRIINFFTWVILGRAVVKFLEWSRDPKNKEKVEALGNLLKTWWPALLGAFVLFTTPLGKFIRVVVGTVTKLTFQLLRKGIPALRDFLKNRDKTPNRTPNNQRRNRRRGNSLVTDDSQKRTTRRKNSRVAEGAGDRQRPGRTSRFRGVGRGGLLGTLGFMGLEMASPFISQKVGDLYSGMGIGDAGLSDEDLLKEYQREKSNIEKKTSGPLGGLLSQRTDYSRLEGLEEELNRRGIAYKNGGQILSRPQDDNAIAYTRGGPIKVFSGIVTKDDGTKVSGAGKDTQAFAVEGGGSAVLQPGEVVVNDIQQKNLEEKTGINLKQFVSDANPPKTVGIRRYSTGGIIGTNQKPSPVRKNTSFSSEKDGYIDDYKYDPVYANNVDRGMNLKMNEPSLKKMQGGGILGGLKNFVGNLFTGRKAKATSSNSATPSKPKVPSWYGPAPLPDYKSIEARALLKTIRTAEHYASTKNPYDTLYGGGTAPITKMTVQEVIRMYDTKKLPARLGGGPANYGAGSGAAGAYQFMPFTLEDLIRRGAVKPNQIMTPDLQDRLGWDLASNVRGLSVSGLKKQGLTQGFMDKIAPEWASIPYSPKGGNSFYGQPVKGSKFLGEVYKKSLPQKKIGGGSITDITTQTGYDIPGGKMGADTQYLPQYNAAVQPGEEIFKYVITKDAAEKGLGQELLAYANQRQADLDSNSNSANIVKNVKPNIPGPRKSSRSNKPIIMPPIQQSAGSKGTPLEKNGSEVPSFPIVSPFSQRGNLFAEYNLLPSSVG
jgi:muramidase (phage lysozyme)